MRAQDKIWEQSRANLPGHLCHLPPFGSNVRLDATAVGKGKFAIFLSLTEKKFGMPSSAGRRPISFANCAKVEAGSFDVTRCLSSIVFGQTFVGLCI